MLINFSNHPSALWEEKQLKAAREYGDIVDIPFPDVSPEAGEEDILSLADQYVNKIMSFIDGRQATVHVMGEMTFAFSVVTQLRERGITCIASTTERDAEFISDGRKLSDFQFVRFRKY